MRINFIFVATLATSAIATPVVDKIAERQLSPSLDSLLEGVTTAVSNVIHELYDNLNGILSELDHSTSSIAATQNSINKGEISKSDGQAKIQSILEDIQNEFTKGAASLQGTSGLLNTSA